MCTIALRSSALPGAFKRGRNHPTSSCSRLAITSLPPFERGAGAGASPVNAATASQCRAHCRWMLEGGRRHCLPSLLGAFALPAPQARHRALHCAVGSDRSCWDPALLPCGRLLAQPASHLLHKRGSLLQNCCIAPSIAHAALGPSRGALFTTCERRQAAAVQSAGWERAPPPSPHPHGSLVDPPPWTSVGTREAAAEAGPRT